MLAATQLHLQIRRLWNRELRIEGDPQGYSTSICKECTSGRLDGEVCSAWGVEEIHDGLPLEGILTVTPGIRPWRREGDQRSCNRAKEMGLLITDFALQEHNESR